jgi:hypothetical protein
MFQVQAPEGEYLLKYTIQGGGTFHIVFSAGEDGAFLAVGLLPGDLLDDVTLAKGEIPDDVEPEIEKQGVRVYCFPGSTVNVTWKAVFKFDPARVIIVLVVNGEIVIGDLDFEVEEMEPQKCTKEITTEVTGTTYTGSVSPAEREAPCGSSRSFKIIVNDTLGFVAAPPPAGTVKDVKLNGDSVLNQVQVLGNGQGHLVIHDIQEEIKMLVELW